MAKWIKGAIKHPGAMTAAAKREGESNSEYEREHMHDSGTAGKRARLAMVLKKINKGKKKEHAPEKKHGTHDLIKSMYGSHE